MPGMICLRNNQHLKPSEMVSVDARMRMAQYGLAQYCLKEVVIAFDAHKSR